MLHSPPIDNYSATGYTLTCFLSLPFLSNFTIPSTFANKVSSPPIPTLFLLFIGYKLGSVIGMIVAVPIGLIVYTMYEEGVFDTTKNSILLLISGINRFRRLEEEDLQQLKETEEQEKAEEKREDNNAKY